MAIDRKIENKNSWKEIRDKSIKTEVFYLLGRVNATLWVSPADGDDTFYGEVIMEISWKWDRKLSRTDHSKMVKMNKEVKR